MLVVLIFLVASLFNFTGSLQQQLTYSEFLDLAKKDNISSIVIQENKLYGLKKNSSISTSDFPNSYDFETYIPSNEIFDTDMKKIAAERLNRDVADVSAENFGFDLEYKAPYVDPWWVQLIPYGIGLVVLCVFWYYMLQQAQGGGSKVSSFGKSKAKLNTDMKNKITFRDVAGADEEKEELEEIVDFLKEPRRFIELGARIPKGVLLVGPPGTGKTLLAKAVAGEAGVPFFSISGSDFVEMFVGVGASRVRDLFDNAKKNSPSIVFIDEIDAVGRQRGAGLGGGHDEREQTLNQLLVEMDGFSINEGVIVIAATNRADILDPALLRPGRFDRQITVNYPDVKGREEILKVHSRNKPLSPDVDLKVIAKRTAYFTGADLENVLNEAAILAARKRIKIITNREIEDAITRVQIGTEKKSKVVTEKDLMITAYHEAGHAILSASLDHCDPVHEVSIIPRGMAGGYTMTIAKEESNYITKAKLLDDITMCMGGRVAEAIIFKDITTGATQDLKTATDMARRIVVEYGMSDEIGPVYLAGDPEIFVGREFGHEKNYSDQLSSQIDEEKKRILEAAYARAYDILTSRMIKLHKVAKALVEKEKIDGQEFMKIMTENDDPSGRDLSIGTV